MPLVQAMRRLKWKKPLSATLEAFIEEDSEELRSDSDSSGRGEDCQEKVPCVQGQLQIEWLSVAHEVTNSEDGDDVRNRHLKKVKILVLVSVGHEYKATKRYIYM